MQSLQKFSVFGIILLAAAGCTPDQENAETTEPAAAPAESQAQEPLPTSGPDRLVESGSEPQNWLTHGRTYDEQRHSPLNQINDQNVGDVGLAWYYDLDTRRGQEATPLVVDGVMYSTSAWSKVQALNAATGELLWQYDPDVPGEAGVYACCDVVNRGVAWHEGALFVGTIDGRLISVDAASGAANWAVQTTNPDQPYTITGAPRVVKGKVLIGNGGAELNVRGYVTAYDAGTGELAWRFYTVPGNPADGFEHADLEAAADTWTGEWWKEGGGGTVWDSMAYDPDLDLLYIGVGNGSPWNQSIRSPEGGDNLYLSSIVALRPDTGEYVWHYQTTPGETWDYTATQHIILADIDMNGENRQVLMQAPKNGFFYVLDRETGDLISAEPFVPVNWATHVDSETGRPIETENARFYEQEGPSFLTPGPLGAHNWQPMSYSPATGLVYIPAQEMGYPYAAISDYHPTPVTMNHGLDETPTRMPDDPAIKEQILSGVVGHLAAWDPVAQQEAWRVQFPGPWNGGILSTAGNLVWQGNAAGFFKAYAADSGEELWASPAQTGIGAAPVTFEVDGEQFVTVVAGWGGIYPILTGDLASKSGKQVNRSRILTFKLGGSASLPPVDETVTAQPEPPDLEAEPEVVATGADTWSSFCGRCHGGGAVGGGVITDLRYSPHLHSAEGWKQVVGEGALVDLGMIGFSEWISDEDIEGLRQYAIERANVLYAVENSGD